MTLRYLSFSETEIITTKVNGTALNGKCVEFLKICRCGILIAIDVTNILFPT